MPIREVAALACKILGLYTIITATVNLVGSLIYAAGRSSLAFAPYILLLTFGLLLWLLADKLAAFMVRNPKPTKVLPINIGVEDLQIMAFSVLGLFFLGDGLPKLVSYIFTMTAMPENIGQTKILNISNLIEAGIQIALGLGLFFGSRGLSGLVNELRHAGLKNRQ